MILDAYIFARDDHVITDVWSAGRHLVTNGLHKKHDEITHRYKDIMRQLGDAI